jgi:hypothetical protein
MSTTLKAALIIITVIYLFIIVRSVRSRKLQTSFSIFWIITGILLIVAVLIPNFIDNISNLLGFEQTSNMIFCLSIFIAFYLIFNLTILISKAFNRNIELIQEVSILKKKVDSLEEKLKEEK